MEVACGKTSFLCYRHEEQLVQSLVEQQYIIRLQISHQRILRSLDDIADNNVSFMSIRSIYASCINHLCCIFTPNICIRQGCVRI